MQNKTRITAVIAACVVIVLAGGLIFAKMLLVKNKAHDLGTVDGRSKVLPSVPVSWQGPLGYSTPDKGGGFIVSKLQAGSLDKIPPEDRDKYEFTSYAEGLNEVLFAGSDKNNKTEGIIYDIKFDPAGLKDNIRVFAFSGKGTITLRDSEDAGNILTFSCGNEEKGYFELKSGTAVFENYYLKQLKENPFLSPEVYEFKELKEYEVTLTEEDAVEKAAGETTVKDILNKAKKITAVLVKYTNKKTPELPGSGIVLKDCPAWVVTFSGVDRPQGISRPEEKNTGDAVPEYIFSDIHIFIGANSGVWLGSISHSSLLQSSRP